MSALNRRGSFRESWRGPLPERPQPGAAAIMSDERVRWRDRWKAWRDSLLSSDEFQAWAARFPLTRPIAQRRASQLFDLCAGFVYSQTLLACVQLRLFERLKARVQSIDELSQSVGIPSVAMARLVNAAIALRLLEQRAPDRIGLGPHGAALLGNRGVLAMVEHHRMLYADLADPVALLSGDRASTQLSQFWAYAKAPKPTALGDADVAEYSQLMTQSQTLVAEDVLHAYSMKPHRCLMDIGGGEGSFAIAAAKRNPHLRGVVFDLPAVAQRARKKLNLAGVDDRVSAIGGDFLLDELPRGADLISLVRVVHDHDDAPVRRLLTAVHAALEDGGSLIVAEPLAGTTGAARVGAAYFGWYLLAMGSGHPRTATTLSRLIQDAGFDDVRELITRRPLQVRVVVGRKGGQSVNAS